MSHSLHRLRPADCPALVCVIDTVCGESAWMATRRFEPTPAWNHALAECGCLRHVLCVARAGVRLAGWCRIFPEACDRPAERGELGIGLLREFRGRGLGTALMAFALDQARQAGFRQIVLTTHAGNLPAQRLFQNCGFQPLAQVWPESYAMVRQLRPAGQLRAQAVCHRLQTVSGE